MRNLTLLAAVAITVTAPLMASQSRADDINYIEMLARESPRGVVRLVLADVAKRGLVGQHITWSLLKRERPAFKSLSHCGKNFRQR